MENKFKLTRDENGEITTILFPYSKITLEISKEKNISPNISSKVSAIPKNYTSVAKTNNATMGILTMMDINANDKISSDEKLYIKEIIILTEEGQEINLQFNDKEILKRRIDEKKDITYLHRNATLFPDIISNTLSKDFESMMATVTVFQDENGNYIYSESIFGELIYYSNKINDKE